MPGTVPVAPTTVGCGVVDAGVTRRFPVHPIGVPCAGVGHWTHGSGLEPAESGRADANSDESTHLDGAGSVRDGRAVERNLAVGTAHHTHTALIVELGHRADQGGLADG